MRFLRSPARLVLAAVLFAAPVALAAEANDAELEARVQMALMQDAKLSSARLTVNAKEEVVYLAGTVETRADRLRAVQVASRVDGVRKVEDNLELTQGRK